MKNYANTRTFVKGHGLIHNPEKEPLLLYFLSPLEVAAFENNFREFSYTLYDETLDVDAGMCRDLFANAKKNIRFYNHLLQFARQKALMRNARVRQFLTMPLHSHQLPTRLYHILTEYECQSMSHVAYKGVDELMKMRGMGNTYLDFLIKLFANNGCANLLV